MTSLHKQINHLKPVTIQTLNPANVCSMAKQFNERVRFLHDLVDTNPHLVSREIEAAYRWQMNANREIEALKQNWESIPTTILDEFEFTTKPLKGCIQALYNPITRQLFVDALKRHNKQALPTGFGADNASPSYHANRGIITANKANKAQRTQAKPLYVQTR